MSEIFKNNILGQDWKEKEKEKTTELNFHEFMKQTK